MNWFRSKKNSPGTNFLSKMQSSCQIIPPWVVYLKRNIAINKDIAQWALWDRRGLSIWVLFRPELIIKYDLKNL
jgi:hypothetical protein